MRLVVDERADRAGLQRRDPRDAVHVLERVDLLLRDHPAVADQHELVDAEALAHLVHRGQQRLGVADVALEDRHRHRAAARVGEQTVVDLQLALHAVAVVAELGQRALAALEVARRQVVEHEPALFEMPRRELLLDLVLPFEQPVHRRVQIVLAAPSRSSSLRQRRVLPRPLSGELARGREDARGDHGDHEVALPRRPRGDELVEAELLHGEQHGLDVAVLGTKRPSRR